MESAKGPVCAVPDEIVNVVPPTTMLPLVIESVYPCASSDVIVNVIVPEAVPLLDEVPTTKYEPWELVTVIVWPNVRLTVFWVAKGPPGGPAQAPFSGPNPVPGLCWHLA